MRVLLGLLLLALVSADVYLHSPRGSNDRLNEQAANRNNADRLFDSQNNNRGGYNVGDKTDNAFDANDPAYTDPAQIYDVNDLAATKQYPMAFYEGSTLSVEWTNQHGCGGNEATDPYNLNCNIILQYMCDDQTSAAATTDPTGALKVYLKDGGNTNTPTAANDFSQTSITNDINANEGRHESTAWYFECQNTDRNQGLFHADQNLNGDTAEYTRQNPNGNQRGLECPEERDYYPYWRPTPFKDIAYLTDHTEYCPTVAAGTMNTNFIYKCTNKVENNQQAPITQSECTSTGGTWMAFTHGLAAGPACDQIGWSRVNHLGNSRNAQPLTYNWTLPLIAGDLSSVDKYYAATQTFAKCIFRLRYNISTDDYDPYATDSSNDDDPNNGVASPVTQNPVVDVGAKLSGLKLAINTAQFGRTFQDRSHVFYVVSKPPAGPAATSATIWNLNVRGKRGNIVQTYPAVEYDYVPNRLHVSTNDAIHIQWTGSNTHDNGNPAGDGQAGDAGEGTGGTDRSNFVQFNNMDQNYPLPLDKYQTNNIFYYAGSCYDLYGAQIGTGWLDCAVTLATSGMYRSQNDDFNNFNPTLDTSPASLIGGVTLKVGTAGSYNYLCTRNNNFTNRSQKGTLVVA